MGYLSPDDFGRAAADPTAQDEVPNHPWGRLPAPGIPDDRDRGLVEKRADHAEAGIVEYWIADPRDEPLTVLALRGETYVEPGRYERGERAASVLLEGFAADASAVFDAPETGACAGEIQ